MTPAARARFDAWRTALPRPLDVAATWSRAGDRFRLSVPYPRDAALSEAWFYPAAAGATDYPAPQTVTRDGDHLNIDYRFGRDVPVWAFQDSALEQDSRQPWRPRQWTVETPGVVMERQIGRAHV